MFACGDCVSTPFEKTAFTADISATLAVRNLQRLDEGRHMLSYPEGVCFNAETPPQVTNISLYKTNGILQFNKLIITGILAASMKAGVEYFYVGVMNDRFLAKVFWSGMETFMLFSGKSLFR